MTIGEKIKYCRQQLGITQTQLAELTGIHPVSIRKYETNKMQPLAPQLEKLSDALGISYNALCGSANAGLRLKTLGDLMGILIVFCNTGLINFSGERNEDSLLKIETVKIQINPILSPYIAIDYTTLNETQILPLQNTFINIKIEKLLEDLLVWEKINFLYQQALESAGETPNKATLFFINDIKDKKERIELELQRSQMMLDISQEVKINLNTNY